MFCEPVSVQDAVEQTSKTVAESAVFCEPVSVQDAVEQTLTVAESAVFCEPASVQDAIEQTVAESAVFCEPVSVQDAVEQTVAESAVFCEPVSVQDAVEQTSEAVVESAVFCEPVSVQDAVEQTYINVESPADTLPSRCVPKHFSATAEKELDSQILEDRVECLRVNCTSSANEESARCSSQESELACPRGVQNRYQDAPQGDMPLPMQEENRGLSFLVV